jgi:hypothetical protein
MNTAGTSYLQDNMISKILSSLTSHRCPEKPRVFTPTKKTEVEIALEQSGSLNALQHYRFELEKTAVYKNGPMPIREFLQLEAMLQDNSQLEQDLSEMSKLPVTEGELEDLRALIWCQRRKLWLYRSEFVGVLKRGLDLWRSNPSWYMHRVLVADCIGRQGCCSRDCGCCVKRQYDPKRKLEANHCTIRCRCCRLVTDESFIPTREELAAETRQFKLSNRKNFSHEMELASIWGLSSESDCSPFDLIERAPEHRDEEHKGDRSPNPYEWDSDSTVKEA